MPTSTNVATGVAVLVAVNTGTFGSPVWTDIGNQTTATLNSNISMADITSKDSGQWKESLATTRDWSVDADAFYDFADAGFTQVKDNYLAEPPVRTDIRLALPDLTNFVRGYAWINYSMSAPFDDAVTISFTMDGTGTLSETT